MEEAKESPLRVWVVSGAQVCVYISMGEKNDGTHSHLALFIYLFPAPSRPTSMPAEVGRPWPTHWCTFHRPLQTRAYSFPRSLQTHLICKLINVVLHYWHHCFCIFICLFVSDKPPPAEPPLLFILRRCFFPRRSSPPVVHGLAEAFPGVAPSP